MGRIGLHLRFTLWSSIAQISEENSTLGGRERILPLMGVTVAGRRVDSLYVHLKTKV